MTFKKIIKRLDDRYHVERKMILNENDPQTMSSLRLTINKNDTKDLHLLIFLIQNAFTGNSAIDIYEDRDALV